MTQPPEPTPGAPADPPSPQNTPSAQVPPWERDGQTFDAEKAWSLIQSLRADNEKHKSSRSAAEQAASQAQERYAAMLKAAGFNPDGTEAQKDPEELAAALAAERDQYREQLEAIQFTNSVQSNVRTAATQLGGNADALLDSVAFIDSLDDLVDEDPTTPEFAAAVQARVQAALERNPSLKASGQAPAPNAPRPDPSQGPRGAARPGFTGSLSDAIRHQLAGKS